MSAVTHLDPLAPLLARNAEHRKELLCRAGGALSADEAARRLGITREVIDERRRAGTLLAVPEGSDWRYPACQFQDGEAAPGLPEVVRGFADAGPWVTLDFLPAPDIALQSRTPWQAGGRDEVCAWSEHTKVTALRDAASVSQRAAQPPRSSVARANGGVHGPAWPMMAALSAPTP